MTTLELEAKKAELIEKILNLDSEEIINKLSDVYKKLTTQCPCQHTKEEVLNSIEKAMEAFDKGDMGRFKSHEELKKRFA